MCLTVYYIYSFRTCLRIIHWLGTYENAEHLHTSELWKKHINKNEFNTNIFEMQLIKLSSHTGIHF